MLWVSPVGMIGGGAGAPSAFSMELNSTDNLNDTPAGAGDSSRIMTIDFWFKIAGASSGTDFIFSADASSSDAVAQAADNKLYLFLDGGSGANLATASTFTDSGVWHHCHIDIDTTQATPANRVKWWIDGSQETLTGTQPTQNYDILSLCQADIHYIGAFNATQNWAGKLYQFCILDGITRPHTDFRNGTGSPVNISGYSVGTNGRMLLFGNSDDLGEATAGNAFTESGTPTQSTDAPPS